MKKLAILGGKPVRTDMIYYGHQSIDDSDIQAVVDVLKSDYLTCGPQIQMLEEKLCQITGARYAVAVSNGTAALHAACYAAGIGAGDEVITTPLTFAATANCILYCGAIPVFADVDEKTYNIMPEEIEKEITEKTRAVIAVDFTGQTAELEQIREICKRNNLILIEDGAHSIGTNYKDLPVGKLADLTTFSFHPVKTVTGGEGGAILTDQSEYYEQLLLFRSHGITRKLEQLNTKEKAPWYYEQIALGFNYRMTDMQAALTKSQLDKLEKFKKRRAEIAKLYDEAFADVPEIILQKALPESNTARHLYLIQLDLEKLTATRQMVYDALLAENVCCNVHYIPVYKFPYYQALGYRDGSCRNTEKIFKRILTIPLYYGMTDADADSVIDAVKKVIYFYRNHN